MTNPFFSVLLPTRNRSEIVGNAIESVLRQSFADFELVVVDDDVSPTATRMVIERHSDPRIRYFRTGNLPMHENWEHAARQARGENILVVEDKQRLVPQALSILHAHLEKNPGLPISYLIANIQGDSLPGPAAIPPVRRRASTELAEAFCEFKPWFFEWLPKTLDSCVPRAVVEACQASGPTRMFFSYINPDYASGFQILSRVPEVLHLDQPLIYIPNNWFWKGLYSNGNSSYKKSESIRNFMRDLPVSTHDILALVPLKCEFLWVNAVIYDFHRLYQRPGHHPRINWTAYHAFVVSLILMGRRIGADMSPETAELKRSLRERGLGFQLRFGAQLIPRLGGIGWKAMRSRLRSR